MSLSSASPTALTGSPAAFPAAGGRADRLLAAARMGDREAASRLLGQWVHRAGIPSLEAFLGDPASFGGESHLRDWLTALLDAPLLRDGPLLPDAPLGSSPFVPDIQAPIEQAPIEQAPIEPSHPEAHDEPPTGPLEEFATEGLADPERDLTSVAAIDPWLPVSPAASAPLTAAPAIEPHRLEPEAEAEAPLAVPSIPEVPAMAFAEEIGMIAAEPSFQLEAAPDPLPAGFDASLEEPEADEDVAPEAGAVRRRRLPSLSSLPIASPLAWGRKSLGRVRSVMRDCLEEAMGSFEHGDPQDVMESEEPAGSLAPAGDPVAAGFPAGIDFTPRSSSAAASYAPPAAPAAPASPPSTVSGPAIPAPTAPAPGPAGLDDLRSWLPDPEEDRAEPFPRAC